MSKAAKSSVEDSVAGPLDSFFSGFLNGFSGSKKK